MPDVKISDLTPAAAALATMMLEVADSGTSKSLLVSLLQAFILANPVLTGTPTAPTAVQTTNNTQIATTAYVRSAIATLVGAAPGILDTFAEIAAALGNDANAVTSLTALINAKTFTSLRPATYVAANATAVAGGRVFANSAGGARTISLPASPASGDTVEVFRMGANNVLVARNSKTIMGAAEDFVLDLDMMGATFTYINSTWRAEPRRIF